jgi:hypothetical protein
MKGGRERGDRGTAKGAIASKTRDLQKQQQTKQKEHCSRVKRDANERYRSSGGQIVAREIARAKGERERVFLLLSKSPGSNVGRVGGCAHTI